MLRSSMVSRRQEEPVKKKRSYRKNRRQKWVNGRRMKRSFIVQHPYLFRPFQSRPVTPRFSSWQPTLYSTAAFLIIFKCVLILSYRVVPHIKHEALELQCGALQRLLGRTWPTSLSLVIAYPYSFIHFIDYS